MSKVVNQLSGNSVVSQTHDRKRKHNADDTVEEDKWKNAKLVEDKDDFGPDDFFSRLPDLCILKVLKHVTRHDLTNMRCVSKRMRPFYYEKSLEKIKWEKCDLDIYQTPRGYAFRFAVPDANYPLKITEEQRNRRKHHNPDFSYHYETYKDDNGAIQEYRYTNGLLTEALFAQRHDWVIPDELFATLANILKHHEAEFVCIEGIPFDTPLLFPKLHALLKDHRVWQLNCHGMPSAGIDDEMRISFAQLMRCAERVTLTSSTEAPAMMNEAVLNVVSGSRLRHFTDQSRNFRHAYERRFNVNVSKLRELVKFHTLSAQAMTLKAHSVAQFCTLYMDAREVGDELGKWEFNVDVELHPEEIARHLDSARFIVDSVRENYFAIRRQRDGMLATIEEKLIDMDETSLRIVTVKFYRVNSYSYH